MGNVVPTGTRALRAPAQTAVGMHGGCRRLEPARHFILEPTQGSRPGLLLFRPPGSGLPLIRIPATLHDCHADGCRPYGTRDLEFRYPVLKRWANLFHAYGALFRQRLQLLSHRHSRKVGTRKDSEALS